MKKKCEEGSKKNANLKKDKFVCKKCGASASDKSHLCKPEKAKQ
jgi:hypothetical protein